MTIMSVDQLIAGLLAPTSWRKAAFTGEAVGEMFSPFFTAGMPGAAAAPTGLNGTALTTYAGQIPVPAAVSGEAIYLADLAAQQGGNVAGIWLCDRLWHNGSIVVTTTGAQAITHPGLPARDRSGTTLGDGVEIGLEVSTATTNAGTTAPTISYTDSAGVAGNTGTIPTFPITAVAGQFSVFSLAAGDTGVRTVESLSLNTSLVTGTVHLVMFRRLAYIPLAVAGVGASMPPGLPVRLYDNSVPFALYDLIGTAGGVVAGRIQWAQG